MQYPSKLLLFGEYVVIKSGEALAIPFQKYSGTWAFTSNRPEWQQDLSALGNYLLTLKKKGLLSSELDLASFFADLKKGLYFESSIPTGYGLGSSGAVSAALYGRYVSATKISLKSPKKFFFLKNKLAQIESYFHGKSSGIDALVSYSKQAVHLKKDKSICSPILPNKIPSFFY